MKRLEKIYESLPPRAQNWAISAQGWLWRRNRYGEVYRRELKFLSETQHWSAERLHQLQLSRLNELLEEAAAHSPYYRETLRGLKSLKTVEEISSLPLLEKDTFRSRIGDLVNRSRLRHGAFEGHTSGTTGAPVIFPYDKVSMQLNFALRDRQYAWAGIGKFDTSVRFSGKLLLGRNERPPFWRYNSAERQWLMSVYHLNDATMSLYFEQLLRIQPVYLDGYPSALFVIAQWINEHGQEGKIKPRAILTTAETLLPPQRAAIECAFACKVFDFYSSSEGAPFITECEHGSRHVNPESGIIEFLRADGSPAEAGEDAEMAVTSFFQRTCPLIRYRISDAARLSGQTECACGRHMPIVEAVLGRKDDMVGAESGTMAVVGSAAISTALYCAPGALREAQVAELASGRFELRYVPVEGVFQDAHLDEILNQLHARLGQHAEIHAVKLSRIPRGANGKFRALVREWKSTNVQPPAASDSIRSSS